MNHIFYYQAILYYYDFGKNFLVQYFLTCDRYKDDVFDRMWFPPTAMFGWTPISTSLTAVMDTTHNDFQPPSVVMDTASTAINASAPMTFNWVPPDNTSQYYVYIHIAEIKALKANESRVFNISLNGELWGGPFIPKY